MYEWILYSFIATIATSLITILIRYIHNIGEKKYLEFYMLISFLCINICLFIYLALRPKKINIQMFQNYTLLGLLVLISVLAVVTVYFSSLAHMIAPNPSYSSTIINFNIVIVLLLSMYLFQSPINLYTGFGMLLVLCGVILIALNSTK